MNELYRIFTVKSTGCRAKVFINVMFNELGDKLYELAKDITEHGLDPSKRLIVFKEKGKYIDGDGNRRVTVLKALETPDLIN